MLNAPLPGSFSLQHEVTIDEAAWWALQTAGATKSSRRQMKSG